MPDLLDLHERLPDDIRDAMWTSNCAGEVFVESAAEGHLRIGHFQGDAALAEFVVAVHEAMRQGCVLCEVEPYRWLHRDKAGNVLADQLEPVSSNRIMAGDTVTTLHRRVD